MINVCSCLFKMMFQKPEAWLKFRKTLAPLHWPSIILLYIDDLQTRMEDLPLLPFQRFHAALPPSAGHLRSWARMGVHPDSRLLRVPESGLKSGLHKKMKKWYAGWVQMTKDHVVEKHRNSTRIKLKEIASANSSWRKQSWGPWMPILIPWTETSMFDILKFGDRIVAVVSKALKHCKMLPTEETHRKDHGRSELH